MTLLGAEAGALTPACNTSSYQFAFLLSSLFSIFSLIVAAVALRRAAMASATAAAALAAGSCGSACSPTSQWAGSPCESGGGSPQRRAPMGRPEYGKMNGYHRLANEQQLSELEPRPSRDGDDDNEAGVHAASLTGWGRHAGARPPGPLAGSARLAARTAPDSAGATLPALPSSFPTPKAFDLTKQPPTAGHGANVNHAAVSLLLQQLHAAAVVRAATGDGGASGVLAKEPHDEEEQQLTDGGSDSEQPYDFVEASRRFRVAATQQRQQDAIELLTGLRAVAQQVPQGRCGGSSSGGSGGGGVGGTCGRCSRGVPRDNRKEDALNLLAGLQAAARLRAHEHRQTGSEV
jgi:hypothetical protein